MTRFPRDRYPVGTVVQDRETKAVGEVIPPFH
jgi:hypothetical protein